MPTYEYRCPDCQTDFQAHHAIAQTRPDCPACGARPERVFLTAPAVHGQMAQGRSAAALTLEHQADRNVHGPGCPCCH